MPKPKRPNSEMNVNQIKVLSITLLYYLQACIDFIFLCSRLPSNNPTTSQFQLPDVALVQTVQWIAVAVAAKMRRYRSS